MKTKEIINHSPRAIEERKKNTTRNLMDYKGYIARVEYDADTHLFYGTVVNLRDVITFHGACVEDLEAAFVDSVEDYLEFCDDIGQKPEKPFSGKFVVRLDPELHRQLYERALVEQLSLNQLVGSLLQDAV